MAKIWNTDNSKRRSGRKATETLFIAGRNATWHNNFKKQIGG